MERAILCGNSSHHAGYNRSLTGNASQSHELFNETTSGWSIWLQVVIGSVLAVIIVATIVGNSLVICAVISFRRLRSTTNLFVVSLAIADITVAILVMPYSLLFELYGEWKFGWTFCYFWISCDVTCCTASILHLCVISLDRYLAITEPLSYHRRMSNRRALAMICTVWFCSGAISFVPIFLGWFADSEHAQLYVDSAECGLYVNKTYAVISSATSFYVPLSVMFFAYAKIFKIAHKQALEIHRLEQSLDVTSEQRRVRLRKRSWKFNKDLKAIRTLGTLMSLFCVSWLPFFLMYLILPFCLHCWLPPSVASLITWLGYTNSCINPGVYAFLNRDFRMAFKKLLTCRRLVRVLKCSDSMSPPQPFGASLVSQDLAMHELKDIYELSRHNELPRDLTRHNALPRAVTRHNGLPRADSHSSSIRNHSNSFDGIPVQQV